MGIYLSKDGISYLWSKIKNKFYIKPSTGIPKSDLASSVQTSLGKADTALQKHQDISGKVDNTAAGADSLLSKITNNWTATPTDDTYFIRQDTSSKNEFGRVKFSTLWSYIKSKVESLGYTKNTGTITGIKMNGASKGTSGVVDLGTVITAHQDISGKQDKSTAVTHSANTAVGSATKPVYVAANGVATPISHSINSDVPANAKFTDTTYSDATQSTHGLMTAADKKKLDGMDLSKYLPLSGGVMTGDIDMQTNKKDILVGTHKANTSDGTAVAGGAISTSGYFNDKIKSARSFMGTVTGGNGTWYDVISARHRNGYADGSNYGMHLWSATVSGGNLYWNKQTASNTWQGDRALLDSANFLDYALAKDGTAKKAELLSSGQMRSAYCHNDDATFSNGHVWFKIGTAILSGGYGTCTTTFLGICGYGKHALYTARIRLTSAGNAVDSIAFLESGRTGGMLTGLFRIVAINGEKNATFELWAKGASRWEGTKIVILNEMYLDGSGKGNFWTLTSRGNADAKTAPTTGNMHVDSSDSSTCATATNASNAARWNGLINDVDTYNSSDTWILVKKDNRIQHRYAGELDVNSAKTLVDSGWSSVTTYIVDKSKFNNISTEFRRIGQIAWVKCSFTPNVAMTNITICDVVNVDPFVAVTPANTVFGVGSASDGSESFIASISYNPNRKLYLRGNFKPSTIYRLMFSYPVT